MSFNYLEQLEAAHADAFRSAHWVCGCQTADEIERAVMEEVRRRLVPTASGTPKSVPDATF